MARLPEETPGQPCQSAEWLLAREVAVECMADLPATDRQLLDGHYWEGLSDRELAPAVLGDGHSTDAPRQATRRRRRHAEKALGRLLLARHPEVAQAVMDRA